MLNSFNSCYNGAQQHVMYPLSCTPNIIYSIYSKTPVSTTKNRLKCDSQGTCLSRAQFPYGKMAPHQELQHQ